MEFVNEGIQDQDMVEYTEDDLMVVDVLLVIGAVINMAFNKIGLRLRGGVSGPLALRSSGDMPLDLGEMPSRVLNELAKRAGATIVRAYRKYRDRARPEPERPIYSYNMTNREAGRAMLAWKNSLTRMYHTYQKYVMSPILSTFLSSDQYVHRTNQGIGPHLYWAYQAQIRAADNVRTVSFGDYLYWDGGMYAYPSPETLSPVFVPKKNFGLGANGTIYIFSADWPGTIMNPDPLTQDSTSSYKYLSWSNFTYQGTVTTPNYPRAWTDVFTNTSWQYLTVYGTQYIFDVTNNSYKDMWLEISLFKFKADIDAMDYEKQVLAHQGGYHGNTNAYIQKLPMMPAADVTVVKTKRYLIKGQQVVNNGYYQEGPFSNNRTIKWNIKRRFVIKRPNLNSYETLTEVQLFNTYYDKQKGLYFRVMGFGSDIPVASTNDGSIQMYNLASANPSIPSASDVGVNKPDRMGQGLMCTMWRKSYFKLDENSPQF